MRRLQTGLRVDPHVLPAFKKLCFSENYSPGAAVERFMKAAVEAKSVAIALNGAAAFSVAQKEADRLALIRMITDIESRIESARIKLAKSDPFHQTFEEAGLKGVVDEVERVLPRIEDHNLRNRAAVTVEAAGKCIREERIRIAHTSIF